jgi:hypothetical protein
VATIEANPFGAAQPQEQTQQQQMLAMQKQQQQLQLQQLAMMQQQAQVTDLFDEELPSYSDMKGGMEGSSSSSSC